MSFRLFVVVVYFSHSSKHTCTYSRAILNNQDLRPDVTPLRQLLANDFWGTPLRHPGSHKSFRPVCVATFRLNYWLHGLRPAGYHAVNIACHSVNSLLFLLLLVKLTGSRQLAILAGLAFAVHPVHTEAVAGVVGRVGGPNLISRLSIPILNS